MSICASKTRVFLSVGQCILTVFVLARGSVYAQNHGNHGVVWRVGSNMRHPPFSSWDAKKRAQGIEVDIVSTAARELGIAVSFVERPFGELISDVASGDLDIAISTIGQTADRARKVEFSQPYFQTEIVALVKTDSDLQTLEQLKNCRIGADKTTTSFSAANQRWPDATFTKMSAPDSSWPQMVANGVIDAFVVDASDQHRLTSDSGVRLKRIPEPLATEQFCIAVKKGNPQWCEAINRAVKQIRPQVHIRIGNDFQFRTPLGRDVHSTAHPPKNLVDDYFAAKRAMKITPNDPDALIWFGRRAGYLSRMNEAIEVFTEGIQRFPNDPRMYRHRGHRWISVRKFDRAIQDLETAVKLIENQPDKIEPDGMPNSENIPLTSTHGNIWYHLGLAYYLKGDLDNALRCYLQRVKLEQYDDNRVANAHWCYMILRQRGEREKAAARVEKIQPEMKVIENLSYHKMCLFYNGTTDIDALELETNKDSGKDVLFYGVGNWYHYERNNLKKTREIYEKLFETGSPFSFAFIAAEAAYIRLFGLNK